MPNSACVRKPFWSIPTHGKIWTHVNKVFHLQTKADVNSREGMYRQCYSFSLSLQFRFVYLCVVYGVCPKCELSKMNWIAFVFLTLVNMLGLWLPVTIPSDYLTTQLNDFHILEISSLICGIMTDSPSEWEYWNICCRIGSLGCRGDWATCRGKQTQLTPAANDY